MPIRVRQRQYEIRKDGSYWYKPEHLKASTKTEMVRVIVKVQPWYYPLKYSEENFNIETLSPAHRAALERSDEILAKEQELEDKYTNQSSKEVESAYFEAVKSYYDRLAEEDQKDVKAKKDEAEQLERLQALAGNSSMESKQKREAAFKELRSQLNKIATNKKFKKPRICAEATIAAVKTVSSLRSSVSAKRFPATWQQTINFLNSASQLLKIPRYSTYIGYIHNHDEVIMTPDQNYVSKGEIGIWMELFGDFY